MKKIMMRQCQERRPSSVVLFERGINIVSAVRTTCRLPVSFHTKQLTAEYFVLLENRLLFACLICCLLISLKLSDLNEFAELKVHILLVKE